jgi:hypothetical protein
MLRRQSCSSGFTFLTSMVQVGQDSAMHARFDPKAAERAKAGMGHLRTFQVPCSFLPKIQNALIA